jgi:hypothetical protein
VALLTTVWLLLLLSIIGAMILLESRAQRRETSTAVNRAVELASLDGALALTLQALTDQSVEHQRTVTMPAHMQWTVGSMAVDVDYYDEAGRLDLNTVDDEWLLALMMQSDMTEPRARANLRSLRGDSPGKQPAPYPGQPVEGPLRGPLQRGDSVGTISADWKWIADCLGAALTVYSASTTPALNGANEFVQRLASWARDNSHLDYAWPDPETSPPVALPTGALAGRVVRLRAFAISPGLRTKEMVVRLTGDSGRPYLVYLDEYATPASPATCGHPPELR